MSIVVSYPAGKYETLASFYRDPLRDAFEMILKNVIINLTWIWMRYVFDENLTGEYFVLCASLLNNIFVAVLEEMLPTSGIGFIDAATMYLNVLTRL